MSRIGLIGAAALATATPALAYDFGGSLDLHAGVASNPFLNSNRTGLSPSFGATLSGALTSRRPTSSTSLSGTANIEQNANKYGRSENLIVQLFRSQSLTEHLSVNGALGYQNTINPQQLGGLATSYYNQASAVAANNALAATTTTTPLVVSDVLALPTTGFTSNNLDLLTLGQRSQRIFGNVGASWQASPRDQFNVGANASHTTYKRFQGDYDAYGANIGYLRTIDGRTKVGIDLSGTRSKSDLYPTATSYNASLLVQRQLNSHWSLDGRIGAIIPDGGIGNGSGTSLSFGLNLCGKYPRYVLCLNASRQAAPTGLGGLRNDLQVGASLSYDLDEHSQISGSVSADRSSSGSGILLPTQKYYQANASYSRTLGPRTSIGGTVRYQRRDFGGAFANNDSYAATVNITRRFGRNG